LRLFHITSPVAALAIIRSGHFKAAAGDLLDNDNGLNCFSYRPGFLSSQALEGKGAQLGVVSENGK
jgi:hypothetical protein